jgi:hypothetical protein
MPIKEWALLNAQGLYSAKTYRQILNLRTQVLKFSIFGNDVNGFAADTPAG